MLSVFNQLSGRLAELFTFSSVNGYTRIRTPFLYPDGDIIDLFAREKDGVTTISDLGETLGWLRMQRVSRTWSVKQRQRLENVRVTHGVELYRGMLVVRVRPEEDVGGAVLRLAEAAVRVADLSFTFRTRAVEALTEGIALPAVVEPHLGTGAVEARADEIAGFLGGRRVPFERAERVAGRSGRVWVIDFRICLPERSALVEVLSTGSRAAARGITEHVLALWYDLRHLRVGPEGLRFVSLFDDTVDVWKEEDFKLVSDLSEVAYWSRPDDFLAKLAA